MSESKKTVVFAASPKPDRYSYSAVQRLINNGHEVVPVGFRGGNINGVEIVRDLPVIEDTHTLTLYINRYRQVEFYDYMLSLKPKRIIFNPGTENLEFQRKAEAAGIETQIACTLVLLSIGNY